MATIIYVEHRNLDGTVYRREPGGNYREALANLQQILLELAPDGLANGDTFRVFEVSDAEQ